MPPISGYFDVVFASSGDTTTVPDGVQPDGSVSYAEGYGINYTLDPTVNPSALNIEQTKMNQLFFDLTSAVQQYQQNGIPPFITTAMNNGNPYPYAMYATVLYLGVAYISLVNDNLTTPPSGSWTQVNLASSNIYTGGTTTGSANAQVLSSLTPSSGFSLSSNGQTIVCTAGFTNTGATTLQITSPAVGPVAIKKLSGMSLVPLTGGEIVATDTINLVVNTSGSCLVLQSSLSLGALAYLNAGTGLTPDGFGNLKVDSTIETVVQTQNQSTIAAAATGTTSAYAASISPAPASLVAGMKVNILTNGVGANTIVGPTFQLNGLGSPAQIYDNSNGSGLPLPIGCLPLYAELEWDGAIWVCLNPLPIGGTIQANQGSIGLPGGLIMKWGTSAAVSNGGSVAVTFTNAFPNNIFVATASPIGSSTNTNAGGVGIARSQTGLTLYDWGPIAYGTGIMWFAIGN